MSKNKIPLIGIAALGGTCVALAIGCLSYRVPDISGVWRDTSTGYALVFQDDGTYIESDYCNPRPYDLVNNGGTLRMEDQLGRTLSIDLTRTKDGQLTLPLNGVTRTLEPSNRKVKFGEETKVPEDEPATEIYRLTGGQGASLKLWSDGHIYQLSDADGKATTVGKWAKDSTGDTLILFDSEGQPLDVFKWTGSGYATGSLTAHLESEAIEANAVELAGYRLTGYAEDNGIGSRLQYRFITNTNIVERTSPGGEVVEFVYGMDPSGLVSMVDMVGKGVTDSIWVDPDNLDAYRHVFQKDSWHQYISEIGGAE